MGVSQKGYDAEILAWDILEKQGYDIIYAPEKLKREKKSTSLEEWIELQHKLEELGYGVYWSEKKKLYTNKDKRILKKSKDLNLTKSQKNNLSNLINQWEKWNNKRNEYSEERRKIKEILNDKIGESIMPKINKKEWENVLKTKIKGSLFHHTFVDVFCKKGKEYYIFDVKHKTFNEKKNPNQFYVTNYEVLNYARIIKENKVKLKILIIVDKGEQSFYKIFDWIDFNIPTSFDPHEKRKTSIRLKDGLDLDKFKVFPHC